MRDERIAGMGELTATIELHRRSLWGRIIRLPRAFRQHYRVSRRTQGRVVSAYVAWLMAGLILKVNVPYERVNE